MADAGRLEERTVEVNDPRLSADANRRLTEAVREVIGADRVLVPADRPRVSQGEQRHIPFWEDVTATKTMALGLIAVGAIVGLIIATTYSDWLLTGVTFVVLAIALAAVVKTIMSLASTTEYPDPSLVALLAEQGVRDPENRFSALVHEFTPVSDDEARTTSVEDDPARATAEQAESITPSGGPSAPVGPDS
jgi:hypothetical protein